MVTINIRYGSETHSKAYTEEPTVDEITSDVNLRALFGYGDNVRLLIAGVEQSGTTRVPGGATVVIETKCNTKQVN